METDKIEAVVDEMINAELRRASNSATSGTVKMRVLLKIAGRMGISLQSIYETKDMMLIDPSVSDAVEVLWNGGSVVGVLFDQGSVVRVRSERLDGKNSEDRDVVDKFLAKHFARPLDISKTVSVLLKRFASSPDIYRELWYVFGADGLWDEEAERFEPYFKNLAFPIVLGVSMDGGADDRESPAQTHVRAVRTLYRDVAYASPERIGATLRRLLSCSNDDGSGDCVTLLDHKVRGDGGSEVSSESSDDSDGPSGTSSDEEIGYDKFIADRYKQFVGSKIHLVTNWIRERLRARTEENNNACKRAAASKRKRSEKANESPDPKIIKTPPKPVESNDIKVTTEITATAASTKKIPKKKKEVKKISSSDETVKKRKTSEKPAKSKKVKIDEPEQAPAAEAVPEKDPIFENDLSTKESESDK